jgi:hypothetical protein
MAATYFDDDSLKVVWLHYKLAKVGKLLKKKKENTSAVTIGKYDNKYYNIEQTPSTK